MKIIAMFYMLTRKILHDTYNELTADVRNNIADKQAEIARKVAEKESAFALLMRNADVADIVDMCKEKISALGSEIKQLEHSVQNETPELISIGEVADYVMGFLTKPLEIWQIGNYYDKAGVLNLCFCGDILYDRIEKFRTPELSQIYGLFDERLEDFNKWRTRQDSNL